MATTTPNYGWDVPTSTDYVKDGATAIETLGDDIDATLWTALGGAYPGLRLVKKQTIGSAVTSVTVTNAFNATYENYLVKISGGVGSAQADFSIQIGNATSAYNYSSVYTRFDTGTVEGLRANSQAEIRYAGGINTTNLQMNCNIDTPFLTRPTILTAQHVVASATGLTMSTYGYLANNNSYTDIKILASSGTLTGGTIYIYGYGAS